VLPDAACRWQGRGSLSPALSSLGPGPLSLPPCRCPFPPSSPLQVTFLTRLSHGFLITTLLPATLSLPLVSCPPEPGLLFTLQDTLPACLQMGTVRRTGSLPASRAAPDVPQVLRNYLSDGRMTACPQTALRHIHWLHRGLDSPCRLASKFQVSGPWSERDSSQASPERPAWTESRLPTSGLGAEVESKVLPSPPLGPALSVTLLPSMEAGLATVKSCMWAVPWDSTAGLGPRVQPSSSHPI